MKSSRRKLICILVCYLILIGVTSCSRNPGGLSPTLTPTEIPTSVPDRITTLTFSFAYDGGESPKFTLKTEVPVVHNSSSPYAAEINQHLAALVQEQVDGFKQNLQALSGPTIAAGSSFNLYPVLVSTSRDLLSLKLVTDVYMDGAAHPFQYTVTASYNLLTGQVLALENLFSPGAAYLEAISAFCKIELASRDIGFDSSVTGADPSADNYRNWNITADGLLITFDEYQVAAYAAGPQIVIVPYTVLKSIIDPQGPLSPFVP